MADYPENIYWLTLIYESNLKLNLVKPIIQRWCLNDKRRLAELFKLSALELSATFGLSDADAEKIIQSNRKLDGQARVVAQWRSQGIETIIRTDSRYPRRLTYTLPPVQQPLVLWAQGPAHLLNMPFVTILGRSEIRQTTEFIQELLKTLEAQDIGLISGYGRGLDRTTFEAMLATENGHTLAILPLGLSAFAKTTTKLQPAVEVGRTLLVSPFSPDTQFEERLAEARLTLIDHVTLALLIPESDEDSQARAAAALERGLPVFVKANTPGNRDLLDRGALLLTDPGEVIDWVQQALVDAAIQEEEAAESPIEDLAAAPLSQAAPTTPERSDDDYTLRFDDISLLDSDEAIEVLSLGGEIPEVLRRRLQQKSESDE